MALLNRLVTLFRVSPEKSNATAESVFNATLTNPPAGFCEIDANGAIVAKGNIPVGGYRLPVVDKLRGAEFELTVEGITLSTHFEVLFDKTP